MDTDTIITDLADFIREKWYWIAGILIIGFAYGVLAWLEK